MAYLIVYTNNTYDDPEEIENVIERVEVFATWENAANYAVSIAEEELDGLYDDDQAMERKTYFDEFVASLKRPTDGQPAQFRIGDDDRDNQAMITAREINVR